MSDCDRLNRRIRLIDERTASVLGSEWQIAFHIITPVCQLQSGGERDDDDDDDEDDDDDDDDDDFKGQKRQRRGRGGEEEESLLLRAVS